MDRFAVFSVGVASVIIMLPILLLIAATFYIVGFFALAIILAL